MLIGILDGQTVQAIDAAKQLKSLGYSVLLICENKEGHGYFTKYAKKKIIAATKTKNHSEYFTYLIKLIEKEKIDIILAMNDDSAEFISKYQEKLSSYVKFETVGYHTFIKAYDKNELMSLCEKYNFAHPKTIDLSKEENQNRLKKFVFPGLIKPNKTSGARGFRIISNKEELLNTLPIIQKEYGHCHLQEFIPDGGEQYKVEIYIKYGEVINAFVIKKIRYYPIKGGSSCFIQGTENNELIELCSNVLRKINWEGFADFDLIEDPRDKKIKIMEINPRVPACIRIASVSGVNFFENIIDSIQKKPLNRYSGKSGITLRFLGLDLLWLIKSPQKNIINWVNGFFSKKAFLQEGDLMDMMPVIAGNFYSIKKAFNKMSDKKGMN